MPLDDSSVPIPGPNEVFVDRNRYITSKWYPWMVRLLKTLKTTVNALDTVQETVDQVNGTWTLSLNSNNRVTGFIKLDGSDVSTEFAVMADKFTIVHPSVNGTTIQAFIAGLVNGVSTIGINGDLVVDGTLAARSIVANSITADKIAAGAITASEIAADAVTADKIQAGTITADKIVVNGLTGSASVSAVADSATSIASQNFALMSSMSLTVTVGANEKILVTFTSSARRTNNHAPAEFELRLNGTRVSGSPAVFYPYTQTGVSFNTVSNPSASFTVILSPAAGTHTLRIYWRNALNDGTAFSDYRYFAAMRFLK